VQAGQPRGASGVADSGDMRGLTVWTRKPSNEQAGKGTERLSVSKPIPATRDKIDCSYGNQIRARTIFRTTGGARLQACSGQSANASKMGFERSKTMKKKSK
jgi:hypothetical protein